MKYDTLKELLIDLINIHKIMKQLFSVLVNAAIDKMVDH